LRRMAIISVGIVIFCGIAIAVIAAIGLDPSDYMSLIAFFGIGGGFALLNLARKPL